MRNGTLLYAQSGGVTAVINATAAAVIEQARAKGIKVLAARNGILGALREELIDTSKESAAAIRALAHTPGGAFGSCRVKLKSLDADRARYDRLLEVLRAHDVRWFLYNGGNDSADTALKVSQLAKASGYDLTCIGVPKTIDNDIALCERSFGFDTAVATATDALRRIESTAYSHHRVMIVETMGRHAGWLALESGIAAAADVILLPEIDYDLQPIIERCRRREQRQRYTIICIGEGAKERGAGLTVREQVAHSPDPVRLGGVGHVLRQRLQPHLQSEVRTTVLGHVQRGGDPTAFDRVLATRFGHRAAQLVIDGQFSHMVTLQGGHIASVPIAQVANTQRKVPLDHELIAMARAIDVCLGA